MNTLDTTTAIARSGFKPSEGHDPIDSKVSDSKKKQPYCPLDAAFQDEHVYNSYLARLNQDSAFSKTLQMSSTTTAIGTPPTPALPTSLVDHRHADAHRSPQRVSGQALSEAERTRIRERYSEKAKERRLRMYEKAILMAEEREREEGRRHRARRQLYFRLPYQTYYGQNVYVVGSTATLGTWNPAEATPLAWSPGNLWMGSVTVSVDDGIVEYKYIAKDSHTGHTIWEPGFNHKIDTSKLGTTTTLNDTWGGGSSMA